MREHIRRLAHPGQRAQRLGIARQHLPPIREQRRDVRPAARAGRPGGDRDAALGGHGGEQHPKKVRRLP